MKRQKSSTYPQYYLEMKIHLENNYFVNRLISGVVAGGEIQ